jgi:hypothetical protein
MINNIERKPASYAIKIKRLRAIKRNKYYDDSMIRKTLLCGEYIMRTTLTRVPCAQRSLPIFRCNVK